MLRIKIFGHGYVGRSVQRLFRDAIIVDPLYSHYLSSRDKDADIAFVCVPTPGTSNGALDTSLVEEVIEHSNEPLIIVRSTVNPGLLDTFHLKNIVYQPEYLGETVNHPLFDEKAIPFMILGGAPENRARAIELYQDVYAANIKIRQVTLYEAEIIKLAENRAITFKIAQCQELWDCCTAAGVDYETIRMAVYSDDPRFNLWHTFVYANKRGFNSKCVPKDVLAFCAWAESIGVDAPVTKALLAYNETLIRDQVRV